MPATDTTFDASDAIPVAFDNSDAIPVAPDTLLDEGTGIIPGMVPGDTGYREQPVTIPERPTPKVTHLNLDQPVRIPRMGPQKGPASQIGAGIINTAAALVESTVNEPAMALAFGTGPAASAMRTVIGAQLVPAVPAGAYESGKALLKGDLQTAVEQGAIPALVTVGGLVRAPKTAEALADTPKPSIPEKPIVEPPPEVKGQTLSDPTRPVVEPPPEVPIAPELKPGEVEWRAGEVFPIAPEFQPPSYPRLPEAAGKTKEQKTEEFNNYVAGIDRYTAELKQWESEIPQNEPIIFQQDNGLILAVTKDPIANWRVTTISGKDKMPMGHEVYNTRFEAVKYAALSAAKRIPKIPFEVEPLPPRPESLSPIAETERAVAETPQAPKETPAVKPATTRTGNRPEDLLDYIQANIGKIRFKSAAKEGSEHFYTPEYEDVAKGFGRRLFDEGPGAQAPDEIVDTLRRQGIFNEDATVDDLWAALQGVKAARRAFHAGETPEQQQDKFWKDQAKLSKSGKTIPINVGDLAIGDKFTMGGTEFTISDINPDTGEVTVKDGPKFGSQTVPDGHVLPVDKGSLEKATGTGWMVPEQEGPEIIGMGGAVPSEFKPSVQTATGIKNAAVDAQRAQRGLAPVMKPLRESNQEQFDRAMARIDAEPDIQDRLIAQLKEKARPLEPVETMLLLHRMHDLRNEFAKATRDINQAFEDGRLADVEEAKMRRAVWDDKLTELEQVSGRGGAGTEQGRGLQARKAMLEEDFSLAKMVTDARADRGGRRLTEDEFEAVRKASEKLQAELADMIEKEKGSQERIAKLEFERAAAELEKQKSEAERPSPYIIKIAEKITAGLDKRANAARERLKGKLFSLSPDVLFDLAEIGASNIAHVGLNFARWSARMISELGDKIKPHLQEVWKASQTIVDEEAETAAPKSAKQVKRHVKKEDFASQLNDTTEKLQRKINKGGRYSISPLAQKLARLFIEQGIKDREKLIDEVHAVLAPMLPDLTRRETMDAISGYGQYKLLSKDAVSNILRGVKGEMQQLGKLADMAEKKAPSKTGIERRTPTDEERRLIKLVNEAKKRGGFQVTDPETQLRTALQAVKTRLQNQIRDLEAEIKSRQRTVKQRTPTPTDAETEALKVKRDELKRQHDQIFGRKGISDQQRLKMAMAAVDRSIEDYERRIQTHELGSKRTGAKVQETPELAAARARRDALKAQLEEMRSLDGTYQEAQHLKATQEMTAEYERRTAAGDFADAPERVRATTPKLDAARERLQTARDAFQEAKAKSPEAIAKAEAAARAHGEELERRINEGDVAGRGKQASPALSDELRRQREENAQMQRILAQMRNELRVKQTPAQRAVKAAIARLANRDAELKEQLASGDFSPRKPKAPLSDPALDKAREAFAQTKSDWEQARRKAQLAGRTWWQKFGDAFVAWERAFKLSSPRTYGKLTSYALTKMGYTAVDEAMGIPWSIIFPRLAEGAPREGWGPNVEAAAHAFKMAWTKGIEDAMKTVKGVPSELERLVKDHRFDADWSTFFGRTHGMWKAPLKRFEYEYSLQKRIAWAMAHGVDVTDPAVMMAIKTQAVDDGLRAILMNRNIPADVWNAAVTFAEKWKSPRTGQATKAGYISARVARWFLPIVRVPTNFVIRTGEMAVGLPAGIARLSTAKMLELIGRGAERTPEWNDAIMRQLKRGSIGAALMAVGYFNPEHVGGYYQRGEKRGEDEVKWGGFQIFGVNLPRWLTHAPWFEIMQIGATMRHVKEQHVKKTGEEKGWSEGAWAAGLGLIEETPFVREMLDIAKITESDNARTAFLGELTKSTVSPLLIQWITEQIDSEPKRKPETFMEHVEMGIPGLRQNVPTP